MLVFNNILELKIEPILKRNGLFVFRPFDLRLTPNGKKVGLDWKRILEQSKGEGGVHFGGKGRSCI